MEASGIDQTHVLQPEIGGGRLVFGGEAKAELSPSVVPPAPDRTACREAAVVRAPGRQLAEGGRVDADRSRAALPDRSVAVLAERVPAPAVSDLVTAEHARRIAFGVDAAPERRELQHECRRCDRWRALTRSGPTVVVRTPAVRRTADGQDTAVSRAERTLSTGRAITQFPPSQRIPVATASGAVLQRFAAVGDAALAAFTAGVDSRSACPATGVTQAPAQTPPWQRRPSPQSETFEHAASKTSKSSASSSLM